MFRRTISSPDLERLKAQREAADRAYHEALSALDARVSRAPEFPARAATLDDTQVPRLNALWAVAPEALPDAGAGSWRSRLKAAVWRLLRPHLQRQQEFNAALVEHVNRDVAGRRDAQGSVEAALAALERHLQHAAEFEHHLLILLQRLTPFIDTKDYEFAGLARRIVEDNAELIDSLDHRTAGLAGGLSGVSDELQKRWESMVARERRFDAKVTSLAAAHERLRATHAIVQQTSLTLKRELERIQAGHAELEPDGEASARAAPHAAPADGRPAADRRPTAGTSSDALESPLDSYKYVGFEDQFRGSRDDIRSRFADYVPYFQGGSDVLDVGCGRGEFLDLLRSHGIGARGLDLNHEMVEVCRARGLQVDEADALSFLKALPDGALGGLFAAQVIEHLPARYLIRLLDVAYHKLRPGARIILETINPACWAAFFQSYIRDLTHVQPVHPDTLSYFLTASGFQQVTIQYRAPYPERDKLQPLPGDGEVEVTVNENVAKLNRLLFTYMDYAAISERP